MSSRAFAPRWGYTTNKASRFVDRVWTQRLQVFAHVPGLVGVHDLGVFQQVFDVPTNGTSFVAASAWTWHSHPVDTLAPSRSASSSAVRSKGRCWRSKR